MSEAQAREHFQHPLETARQVRGRLLFLPTVAVGGTAAALYARHRVSLDVDFVTPYLCEESDQDLERVRAVCEQFALNVIESQADQRPGR